MSNLDQIKYKYKHEYIQCKISSIYNGSPSILLFDRYYILINITM